MKKRIVSLLLAVVLIVSMLPGTIVSASTTESTAMLTVEEPWANPGGTVDVNLIISENPGVLGATLVVSWDESLTLVADTSGEAFSHMTYTSPSRYTASGTNFVWFGNEVGEAMDGIVLTLTFEVPDTAENNEILPVWVAYTPGDVVDGNDNDVTFSITDGYVRVITYKPGDVNGDTRVNSRDLVRLSQYISDGNKTDPEGYNAEVVADACDVNGDGRVNARDLIRLSQYVSDGSQTDPEGYNAVLNPAKLPECGHTNMQANEAKAAECTVEGNIAYWYCADCAKYFINAEATNEIAYIDTVISATGHTTVVDEAVAPSYTQTGLTEGSHCGVCGEVIMAQETVPMLQATYHAVIYRNLQGAESPTITQYAEHKGLAFEDVPDPVRLGYTFLGWYTASEGGTKVDMIEVGTTTDVTVYAHWEAISYTITYEDAAVHSNADTYTIEDEILLRDAEWSGLVFSHWSDENGNKIAKIDKGTIGNKVVTANWISEKNLAIPSSNNKAQHIIYDDELNRYYFIYETGRIENVVISSLGTDDKNAGEELKWILSDTVTVENNIADTVARTVSNSFQQTDEWSENYEWIVSESASISSTITAGLEVEEFGVKAKIEAAIGAEESTETTNSRGYGKAGSITGGMESSDAISSTVSYTKGISTTITKEVTIPGNMPKGKYSYVCAGTVRVYAILTYDAATQNYYFDTYSVLDDELYEKRMYEAPANTTANIQSSEGLPFTFDTEEIKNLIDSVYYVQYDANGGEGMMLSSAFRVLENGSLLPNKFVRNGYVFAGWSTSPNGSVEYCDNATVSAIAQSKEVVQLYAVWEVDPYSIGQYVATGSVVTDSDNSDSYTVYNTIASTPVSTTGRVIVDWRNDADTNLLNYPEKGTNGRLDISNSTTEILFIGSTGKTYSNLCLQLNDFEDDQTLVLRFMNFNFESNAATAICTNNGSAINLTIDVIGSSSIKNTKASGSVVGTETAPIEKLYFVGTGVMQLIAGDGATVTAAGMSGNDGGVAVYAKNIVFDMDSNAKLHIYGGDGSDGVRGADGADGTTNNNTTFDYHSYGIFGAEIQSINHYNKAYAGEKGKTGGNGGNGGLPVVCETLIANTPGLTLVYGNGGDGGAGGSGGDGGRGHNYYGYVTGVSYLVCYAPGQGGDAGDGGDGGDAGHSVVHTYNFDNVEIIAGMDGIAGGGGTPGLKGIGGNGGETSGTANYYSAGKAADGLDGDIGAAGNP